MNPEYCTESITELEHGIEDFFWDVAGWLTYGSVKFTIDISDSFMKVNKKCQRRRYCDGTSLSSQMETSRMSL
ncbi:hypothetical protein T4D_16513 [Trichinella pseudospiralis]|nr:hypothetical protein T4D_16513 [Trichinella pseudospiralis]